MIKKIFTFLMVLYPIINIYLTPIPSISVADIILIIFVPFILIDMIFRKKKMKINIGMGIILIYMIIQILLIGLFCSNEYFNKLLLPTARLLLYYGTIAFISKNYFDMELGCKILKKAALLVTYFLFIQIVFFYVFHIFIQGTIPGLHVAEGIDKYNHQMVNASTGRLRSVFLEPSYYAIYVILALGIELLTKDKIDKKTVIVLTLGLLISASGTAVFMVGILYIVYIFKNLKKFSNKSIRNLIILFLICMILFPIYMQTESYKIFYERTFGGGDSVEGRFGNYGVVLEDLNNINLFFGRGILKLQDDYIPTIPRIFFYYGLVGVIFFIIVSIRNFIKLKGRSWIVWLILFILMFPTIIFFENLSLLYIPFMSSEENNISKT